MKVHFGVFGFTGAGKSNLVSTGIATVFPKIPNSKVVLFDDSWESNGTLTYR